MENEELAQWMQGFDNLSEDQFDKVIDAVPDDLLYRISFTSPWQYDSEEASGYKDPDTGAVAASASKEYSNLNRAQIQKECWDKFQANPQVNTSIRDIMGRLTGDGFGFISEEHEIQEVLDDIYFDHRNRLYSFMPKFLGRTKIEGELHLALTCHNDGFIEVDFIDPSGINQGGDDDTGIIYHPTKTIMPLFFNVSRSDGIDQVPSVFIARYPYLVAVAKKHQDFRVSQQVKNKRPGALWKQFGGYYRFIVNWDVGLLTRRTVSYLRTTLEWLNQYENLKKYEIDHKKSSAAYAWVFSFDDARAFKAWLKLSDADKKKTAIMAKITPGSRLILPPGMSVKATSPQLAKISDSDTDILEMISSGLNQTTDTMMGKTSAPYSGAKASATPMSDRISDERSYFERFLVHDFWSAIFFLRTKITNHSSSKALTKFPETFTQEKVIGFNKESEITRNFKTKPEFMMSVLWPQSAFVDAEATAKAMLGSKHGNISATLGIPNSEIAKRLNFAGYGWLRQRKAEEDRKYPKLMLEVDQESVQEKLEGEPKKTGDKPPKKGGEK